MKIALAGKGGVGKTTISAALIELYAEKGHRVLAVDADPDANLGAMLGVPADVLERQPPIIEMKELVESRTGQGSYLILNPEVDDILERFRLRLGDISLFRMGGVKGAGTQCYCKENAFLKAVVSSLVLGLEDLVVIDFGAGIEHLTRGTASGVDLLIVVTEPTRVSGLSATSIVRLARSLGVPCVRVIGNKVRTQRERDFLAATFGEDLWGVIAYDEAVAEAALGAEEGNPAGTETVSAVLRGELRLGLERLYPEIQRLTGGQAH
jgi:CO dehydrogenase maturation factor